VEGREQDIKHLKKYVGTNYLSNETQEREKSGGNRILAIWQ
jgi:hypothetical protein